MSNVIPIVSSSPPPLDDDDEHFKWDDDDDDEFGNFTSATSVSATSVASDSSIAVNSSNSETSTSARDVNSNGSPIKSGSKLHHDGNSLNISNTDCATSESVHSSTQKSHASPDVGLSGNGCEDVEHDDNDFQDFAQFGSADLSESSQHAAGELLENKSSLQEDLSLYSAQNGSRGCDAVDASEEDDFQDFAQFNDADVVSESWQSPTTDKPECDVLSQGEAKTGTDMSTTSGHSNKDVQSSSLDRCSEAIVADSEPAGPVHWKNNDSIYSSASTVDSGVFSTDMSPSCHPGEAPEICQYTEKDNTLTHKDVVAQETDIPASNSFSSLGSPSNADSLEVSEEHSKNITSFDSTSINNNNNSAVLSDSSSFQDVDSLISSGGNLCNNHQSEFIVSGNTEGCASGIEGHCVGLSNKEECVDDGLSDISSEHSAPTQRVETSNHSNSASNQDGSSSAGFVVSPDVVDDQAGLGSSVDRVDFVESPGVDVSSDESNHVLEDEPIAIFSGRDRIDAFENGNEGSICHELREPSKSDLSSSSGYEDEPDKARCDLSCEIRDGAVKEQHKFVTSDKLKSQAVDFDEDVEYGQEYAESDNGGVENGESSIQATNSCEYKEVPEDVDEEDFGEFGCCVGQTDEDSHEIPPITFRTSICESAVDGDEDDFSFDRERPPELDVEGGSTVHELGEGRASNNISGGDDEFGEFDSAQTVHPNNVSSSINKSGGGDGIGDFDKLQAADDDSGWADFGAAASPEKSGSVSSATVNQVPAATYPEQSKAQKLRQAVISCFPDEPLGQANDLPQKADDKGEELEIHSQNGEQSKNMSGEDDGPLPLETVVELGLSNVLEAKQQTWTVVQHPAKKDPKVRMWAHLKDVDSCHALLYGWHTSHCSKEVFTTLHIDTQNILFTHKKQAVPFFASGLGILEPIRGGGTTMDRKKDKTNLPATQSILLESSKHKYNQSPAPQDIPPVDFDWSSSGLTNPLTVFKADSHDPAPTALQPLEEIMKKTTPTVKLATNEVWSPEAVCVLEKMPDLSFMHSRVLMFPVKQ